MSRSFTPSGNGECSDWCCPWYARLKAPSMNSVTPIERIPPAQYLASSYYERWLAAAETLLVERGVVTREELLAKEDASIDPALIANAVPARGPTPVKDKSLKKPPRARFVKGDRVRGRNLNPSGHTRLPRYVRGKSGVIARDWGVFDFADTKAHRAGAKPQHCYSVAFDARELWGKSANSRERVYIDLWEDYLEPVATKSKSQKRKRVDALEKELSHEWRSSQY